jgi:TRAP-type C4-dicarboxylate transport system permease small subunit
VIDRVLGRAAAALALAGGVVVLAAVAVCSVSIVGRWLADAPVLGDVEVMQLGCVVAISCFLPWCQTRDAHVRVDFFTQRASALAQRRMDRAGHLLMAMVMLLVAARTSTGVAEMREAGETTMLLGLPVWMAYLCLVPGLLLSGLIALRAAFATATVPDRRA